MKLPPDSLEKPRFFRDRRDKEKLTVKRETPKSPPYERPRKDWKQDAVIEEDADGVHVG